VVSDAERGNQVGDLCFRYDLPVVTADGETGTTIDPTATGKITIVNFWGTWCTPCINELPYFDRIATEYPEDVTVIAIHSSLSNENAPAFIDMHYPKSEIIFARDEAADTVGLNGAYYTALGGRGSYPYTVVLDEEGYVREIFLSSVSYSDLKLAVTSRLDTE
jgi:thiol-disulfide isomerase/thioredoxin